MKVHRRPEVLHHMSYSEVGNEYRHKRMWYCQYGFIMSPALCTAPDGVSNTK